MGESDNGSQTVEKGDEHLSARIDAESYRRIRVAAAMRDESIAEFLRESVSATLTELEKGNPNRATVTASS